MGQTAIPVTSWLTVLIAGIVALIAVMQWHVARQKFVLDLFDRRFKAYNDVLNAVRPIVAAGNAEQNDMVQLHIAVQNSKFLFGSDVNDYLLKIIKAASGLKYWNTIFNTSNPQAHKAPEGIEHASLVLTTFFEDFPDLCQHYMMMPEKRVRTPVEWFRDRNALRKSYGAEQVKIEQ